MSRAYGERRELARRVRKDLAVYLYFVGAPARDEERARKWLLTAERNLARLLILNQDATEE